MPPDGSSVFTRKAELEMIHRLLVVAAGVVCELQLDRKVPVIPDILQRLNHIISVSNGRVPAELYDCVFAGEVSVQTLEDTFYVFNMEHPSGYKGRSLSVSDVVEIFLASGESEFYYCEPIGFKRIRFEKG